MEIIPEVTELFKDIAISAALVLVACLFAYGIGQMLYALFDWMD